MDKGDGSPDAFDMRPVPVIDPMAETSRIACQSRAYTRNTIFSLPLFIIYMGLFHKILVSRHFHPVHECACRDLNRPERGGLVFLQANFEIFHFFRVSCRLVRAVAVLRNIQLPC